MNLNVLRIFASFAILVSISSDFTLTGCLFSEESHL